MTGDILRALGGIGIFLIGMMMLTEGLRGLAGKALRRALARFTATPAGGAATGALATAVVQSSSAVTVTAVGFVGAGLLTFPQALGVIFGANIGTTATGWIVAVLGFKVQLGTVALPLVFAGVLLRLMGRSRLELAGKALAGFGLLFVGLEYLRQGAGGFEGIITPADLPGDTVLGRIELVLLGLVITVITQSSSAGVATALVALGSGAIALPQAAAMVIGMDVGTTCTAALATIGGSTASRRTGLSHVIYNILTAVMAFLLLGPYVRLAGPWFGPGDAPVALVVFHTGFNVLGVLLVLPFTGAFARLVMSLVPERGPRLTGRLDDRLLGDAAAATDAAAGTVEAITQSLLGRLTRLLGAPRQPDQASLPHIAEAIAATRTFVERIAVSSADAPLGRRLGTVFHLLDHLGRLRYRCVQAERIATLAEDRRLRRLRDVLRALVVENIAPPDLGRAEARINRFRRLMRRQRHLLRERTIAAASTGAIEDEAALRRLDAGRWLHRVSYHVWRIRHHLNALNEAATPTSPNREAAIEVLQDRD